MSASSIPHRNVRLMRLNSTFAGRQLFRSYMANKKLNIEHLCAVCI